MRVHCRWGKYCYKPLRTDLHGALLRAHEDGVGQPRFASRPNGLDPRAYDLILLYVDGALWQSKSCLRSKGCAWGK